MSKPAAGGEQAIRELAHALLAFEVTGESRRAAFEQTLERCIRSYLDHMAVEEREILPAARLLVGLMRQGAEYVASEVHEEERRWT